MLERYYRNPIKWDYSLATALVAVVFLLVQRFHISIPSADRLISTVSDVATISLTLAGFVLTLLTVIISFKSSSKLVTDKVNKIDSTFDVFLATSLYFKTVMHLKNAIRSLTAIALLGYLLKLLLSSAQISLLYYYCVAAIIILLLTLSRCVFILSKIVKMQERNQQHTTTTEVAD